MFNGIPLYPVPGPEIAFLKGILSAPVPTHILQYSNTIFIYLLFLFFLSESHNMGLASGVSGQSEPSPISYVVLSINRLITPVIGTEKTRTRLLRKSKVKLKGEVNIDQVKTDDAGVHNSVSKCDRLKLERSF